ncbi:MAG: RagB/SusD family nutrient uptake outer membrane protein, partial [Saprospiraceae bacterium]|nr:RagB/SusD family nutrient uptake outer membrane protein [Saprospiraceae bacterium]
IFAIPFDGLSTQTWGGTTYLVHAPIGGSMDATQYGVNGGWFGIRTTSAFVDKFTDITGNSDERAIFYTDGQSKEISETGIPNFNEGYAVPKFTNVTRDGQTGADLNHPDTDFPMFRLADVYLMYAEAVLRGGTGGDVATAVGYINQLRNRAYDGDNGNITEGELTLDFILDERSRELYFEGHRRTDLIRFNQFSENGVWPHKGGTAAGQPTEAFRNLFPIPATEILANPKLEQNPGYF